MSHFSFSVCVAQKELFLWECLGISEGQMLAEVPVREESLLTGGADNAVLHRKETETRMERESSQFSGFLLLCPSSGPVTLHGPQAG